MNRLASFFFFGLSIMSVVWVASSLLAPSYSQEPPPPPPPPSLPAVEQAPAPAIDHAVSSGGAPFDHSPPATDPTSSFSYDPTGRRDPFRPYGVEVESSVPPGGSSGMTGRTGKTETLTDLQTFDLQNLKVVAISWGGRKPSAIIRDPTGKHHIVRKFSKVGKASGFVGVIREGEVVIIEPAVVDGMQTAVTRTLLINK